MDDAWIKAEYERNRHLAGDLVGLNIPSLTCPPTLHSYSQDIIETDLRARELERVIHYHSERNLRPS